MKRKNFYQVLRVAILEVICSLIPFSAKTSTVEFSKKTVTFLEDPRASPKNSIIIAEEMNGETMSSKIENHLQTESKSEKSVEQFDPNTIIGFKDTPDIKKTTRIFLSSWITIVLIVFILILIALVSSVIYVNLSQWNNFSNHINEIINSVENNPEKIATIEKAYDLSKSMQEKVILNLTGLISSLTPLLITALFIPLIKNYKKITKK